MERAPRTAAQIADPADVRGQMDDRVGLRKEPLGHHGIPEIAVTASQRPDLDPALRETRDDMRSEEPPGAGDVDLHRIPLWSFSYRIRPPARPP